MTKIYFDFYGKLVEVESSWTEILILLRKDFSFFSVAQITPSKKFLKIKIEQTDSKKIVIPGLVSKMQSLNSITYQEGLVRYNDYYGKLLSIFDYSLEVANLYGSSEDKMHEIAYLLILSRVGKSLDRDGLHKLHAFAVSYKGIAFVCMMPTKGGKSTLLLELLKNCDVKMISDDIPLINNRGEVLPFPIKIGIESEIQNSLTIENPADNIYFLNREQYGRKVFICLEGVKSKVESIGNNFSRVIIAEGFRFNSDTTEIISASWFKIFLGLFKHGVIGIGLPMILEYFWEFGVKDFFVKTEIFFKRLYSFFIFSINARKISIKLGANSKDSADKIIRFLEEELSAKV